MKAHIALCLSLVGCVADSPTDPELSEVDQPVQRACDIFECGSNSPVIAAVESWEFREAFNVANNEGFVLTRVEHNGVTNLKIDVVNDEIILKYKTTGAIYKRGLDVRYASLWFLRDGKEYQIYIGGVDKTPYWGRPVTNMGNSALTWAYKLQWRYRPAGEAFTYVCGETPEVDGLADFWSVVYADEHIDADNLRVLPLQANWFNIGCAGHTLSKMHLMGYTEASRPVMTWPATLDQRQAVLKMLTASYCPGGDSFTVAGQKLLWRDQKWTALPDNHPVYFNGPFNNTAAKTSAISMSKALEARWDKNGATCLNTPRAAQWPSPDAADTFPNVLPEIQKACGGTLPPPCTGTWQDQLDASIVSVNWKYNIISL